MPILRILFILLSLNLAYAQRFAFTYNKSSDPFIITNDDGGVYCLFPVGRTDSETIFRKVFLNGQLRAIDSIDYRIPGKAEVRESGGNGLYTFHAFYTKSEKVKFLFFLVTDKRGNVVYEFKKTAVDLMGYSQPGNPQAVQPSTLQFQFLSDVNEDIMYIRLFGPLKNSIVAWKISDGKPVWAYAGYQLDHLQMMDSLIVGAAEESIVSIRKDNGVTAQYIPFRSGGTDIRNIAILANNGTTLMVAGDQYPKANLKHGRFFIRVTDLAGNVIYDKVDTTDRMGKYRRHLLGSVFDNRGNLVLIGDGFKVDATKAIASTAASVALTVALGVRPVVLSGNVENRVDFVLAAVMSPETGEILGYYNFPVGPWYQLPGFISDGRMALIAISNKFLLYNVDDPSSPPTLFASTRAREHLLLTPYGPVISYRDPSRKKIVIEALETDNKK